MLGSRIGTCTYITRPVGISCPFMLLLSSSRVVHISYCSQTGQNAFLPFPRRHQWPFDAAKAAAILNKHTQDNTRNEQSTTTNAHPCTANNTTTKCLRSTATKLRPATNSHDEREAIHLHHRARHPTPQARAGTSEIEEHVVPSRDHRRLELQGKKRSEGTSCRGDA